MGHMPTLPKCTSRCLQEKTAIDKPRQTNHRGHDGGGRGGGGWRGHGDRVVSGRSARNKHHKNPACLIHDQNKHQQEEEKKKKRPRRVLSRVRSLRTKTEKRLEKKYPKTVFVVVTLRLMFELVRYYADVVGDAQLVWQMRNNDQLRGPFLAMVFFIGLQLCLGSAGLVAYMRYEHKASIAVLLAVSVFSPPLVLALDTLMLMYRPTVPKYNDR